MRAWRWDLRGPGLDGRNVEGLVVGALLIEVAAPIGWDGGWVAEVVREQFLGESETLGVHRRNPGGAGSLSVGQGALERLPALGRVPAQVGEARKRRAMGDVGTMLRGLGLR